MRAVKRFFWRVISCDWLLFFATAIMLSGCAERHFVRTTPQMDTSSQFWIRVLLLDDASNCTLNVSHPFLILKNQLQTPDDLHTEQKMPANITVKNGKFIIANKSIATEQLVIFPGDPHIFNLNGASYRGKLKLLMNNDGQSFDAVNYIPLEPYLAGVVGAEMPDYWEPAALAAQAIAARTYCLYIKKRFGKNRNWDLKQTAAHQVYKGLKAESKSVWQAVKNTWGQILVCNQQNQIDAIFPTYYSSTCGGQTENSKNVFGDSFGPLKGTVCSYCESVAKPHLFFWPKISFTKTEITEKLLKKYPKLKKLGKIKNIRTKRKTDCGKFSRLTMVELIGSNGKVESLRAEDLRLTLDPTGTKLRSTICQIVNLGEKIAFISGRGFGHGVGMCQCGAQGLARKGRTAGQILNYYYPGSKIKTLY